MMDPRLLSIDDFNYPLPDERIAAFPEPNRDDSRLLIVRNNQIREDRFKSLASYLPANAFMVLNNTRVVEARLIFHKPTGAKIEIFCIEPDDSYTDVTTAMSQHGSVLWKCLVGRSSSWTHGTSLEKKLSHDTSLFARIVARKDDHFIIQLSWVPEDRTFAEILHLAGSTPLPPYIKRKANSSDAERYQTVYAQHSGSVAAPTAGLHFTENVFRSLDAASISYSYVTLHVSAGTFKPVKAATMSQHDMHAEFIEVNKDLIDKLVLALENNRPVIAVGTTSIRTLESLYWMGLKTLQNPEISSSQLHVQQWEPYDTKTDVTTVESLHALRSWLIRNDQNSFISKTSLLIAPSYSFRTADILITNFHQPKSTLLLLVAAFAGEIWKSAYAYALDHNFRFLSYGDSCLFFRK